MGDVFQEVDEDVRREQLLRLWRRYGWLVIAALVLIVLGTAGVTGWTYYKTHRMMADGARFEAATVLLDSGDSEAAARAFSEVANQAGGGYPILARFREAVALLESGDREGAIAVYDRLAGEDGVGDLYRDLAALLAASHTLDAGRAGEAADRLVPLSDGAGPWRHMARELRGLAVLEGGGMVEAQEIFSALVEDVATPPGVRNRAGELLSLISGHSG
ncbi:MAG: tetratricopeptide repeat protein [Alphaproteobacteria bacterium]|nr:tetratricopeptide repeat protein [Alphaproteobacteria bacterium]MDP6517755.1 tetratricopeptide repeat protein [Alphaproteobacteria bacterium]